MKTYHHRKPIILRDEDRLRWLANDNAFDFNDQMSSEQLAINSISKAVNDPSVKDLVLTDAAE